jgi:hypothetical protein
MFRTQVHPDLAWLDAVLARLDRAAELDRKAAATAREARRLLRRRPAADRLDRLTAADRRR